MFSFSDIKPFGKTETTVEPILNQPSKSPLLTFLLIFLFNIKSLAAPLPIGLIRPVQGVEILPTLRAPTNTIATCLSNCDL